MNRCRRNPYRREGEKCNTHCLATGSASTIPLRPGFLVGRITDIDMETTKDTVIEPASGRSRPVVTGDKVPN